MSVPALPDEVAALCRTVRLKRRLLPDTPLPHFLHVYPFTVGPFIAMLAVASWWPSPLSWLGLVLVAGVTQNALGILTHEASHSFLHRNRKVNDVLADWFVCQPIFNTVAGYRREHFMHHRGCCGPHDPYYGLYGPYARRWDMIRAFLLDATGLTAVRAFVRRYGARSTENPPDASGGIRILVTQAVIAATMTTVTGQWWAYPAAWVLPLLTVPFAINRVRTFVEHYAGPDGPEASRTTVPTTLEWLTVAPYGYAHHFEHHLMPDIPYYHLSWAHAELGRLGFSFRQEHLSRGGYVKTFARLFRELT